MRLRASQNHMRGSAKSEICRFRSKSTGLLASNVTVLGRFAILEVQILKVVLSHGLPSRHGISTTFNQEKEKNFMSCLVRASHAWVFPMRHVSGAKNLLNLVETQLLMLCSSILAGQPQRGFICTKKMNPLRVPKPRPSIAGHQDAQRAPGGATLRTQSRWSLEVHDFKTEKTEIWKNRKFQQGCDKSGRLSEETPHHSLLGMPYFPNFFSDFEFLLSIFYFEKKECPP